MDWPGDREILVDVGLSIVACVMGIGFLVIVRIQRPGVMKPDAPIRRYPGRYRYALGRLRGGEIMGRVLLVFGLLGVIVVGITRL
jgi:hypothetical protein